MSMLSMSIPASCLLLPGLFWHTVVFFDSLTPDQCNNVKPPVRACITSPVCIFVDNQNGDPLIKTLLHNTPQGFFQFRTKIPKGDCCYYPHLQTNQMYYIMKWKKSYLHCSITIHQTFIDFPQTWYPKVWHKLGPRPHLAPLGHVMNL